MFEKQIILLTDNNGYLCESLKSQTRSVDIELIVSEFIKYGWKPLVIRYSDIDFTRSYSDYFILYASSEDYGLFYKDYIEDIILWFQRTGNILLPEFDYFRAHHNKVYMELYRNTFKNDKLKTITTKPYSNYDELKKQVDSCDQYPFVIKSSAGAGSSGVALANNRKELLKYGKKFAKRIYYDFYANLYRSFAFQKLKNYYRKIRKIPSVNYKKIGGKFVVQTFIANLKNDYKVLVFGSKYYLLKRNNRNNDFRASGSGKFEFPDRVSDIEHILDFAAMVKNELNQPILSLDIAYDGNVCHLIEYQAINFGPYTLEYSNHYFSLINGKWNLIDECSILEMEIVKAINEHYSKIKNKEI